MRKDVFLYVGQRRQTCLRIRTFVYGFLAIYIPETKDSSETEHMLRGTRAFTWRICWKTHFLLVCDIVSKELDRCSDVRSVQLV